ncbi:MAG TPA: flagellar hook-length control protein FliK [Methylococcaceae bacterium]|nr:flagellar hook-length control protein FliK [Methylococcaceae bacterium]
MEIQLPSALLPTPVIPKASAGLLPQLEAGQRMVAVVEAVLSENSFLLKLTDNSQLLRAQSQLTLSPGQILKLEVVTLGPTPELKILPPERAVTPEKAAIEQALRQYLPKQQGLADLAPSLKQAVESTAGANAILPEALKKTVRAALDALPSKAALMEPEGLKQAIKNSGLFFEAKLANLAEGAQALTGNDLKSRLLALVDMLKNLEAQAETPLPTLPRRDGAAVQDPDAHVTETKSPAPPATAPANASAALEQNATPLTHIKEALNKLIPSLVGQAHDEPNQHVTVDPEPVEEPNQNFLKEALNKLIPALVRQAHPERTQYVSVRPEPVKELSQSLLKEPGDGVSTSFDPALGNPLDLKTLLHKTEGALAKIVLDQLASLPQNEGEPITWQIEIPFSDGRYSDSAKLRIVREGKAESQAEQAYWSVLLELNPPNLGTIHSRITLIGERIETYFWSDLEATSKLINSRLELLAARLQQAGLEVGRLDTLAGAPGGGRPENRLLPAKLVDERA